MYALVARAAELARSLASRPWEPPAAGGRTPERVFAIGDPQATAESFFEVLARHDLLGPDGCLRSEAGLISVGDHFDFDSEHRFPEKSGGHGLAILSWLAAHPREQVVILFGNHDAGRVMELAAYDDERFAAARTTAQDLWGVIQESGFESDRSQNLIARFRERFPELPTGKVAVRDFAAFSSAQQWLVKALLLAGRFRLGHAANRDGLPLLMTHAGVTRRELNLLRTEENSPPEKIARSLNEHLHVAVGKVRKNWEAGGSEALDLRPLHWAGCGRRPEEEREGGGLLYHRPALREVLAGREKDHQFEPDVRRRFEPRESPPRTGSGLRPHAPRQMHRRTRPDHHRLGPGRGAIPRPAHAPRGSRVDELRARCQPAGEWPGDPLPDRRGAQETGRAGEL